MNDKTRQTPTGAFVIFAVVILLVMIFPVYALGNRVDPFVLGMPFSMFWVLAWVVVELVGLVAFYLYEYGR